MTNNSTTLLYGDCLDLMRDIPTDSVDAIVTDPPYGLSFMGKDWDHGVPGEPFWKEALRVAKPGAHLLAFGGTRTYHRLACAIEDAGWAIRDCIMWVFGCGWPKSLNVGLAIDKALGQDSIDTGVMSPNARPNCTKDNTLYQSGTVGKSFSIKKANNAWDGYGTALKPALEPIVVARKPIEGTVAENVLKYGTGAINIDACRVPLEADDKASGLGRFPSNLIHDGSPEVLNAFPNSKGQCGAIKGSEPSELTRGIYGKFSGKRNPNTPRGDSGSAARFFYCAKASRAERGEGNVHPTVKPLALMRYLITLVTPEGATVLDPFMGSGSTGVAAAQLFRRFIGIEKDASYYSIAQKRINEAIITPKQATFL